MNNPYLRARNDLSPNAQDRNRQWWDTLPMTYEDWGLENRDTDRDRSIRRFLESNPFLSTDYFGQFRGKRVLEIGCGSGAASCLFSCGGARVTAIDLSTQSVEMTRRNSNGLSIDVLQMDAESLGFPENTFDYVFSWGVLHHSANPAAAFREVARVLKQGGEGLIMVYNRASLRFWLKGLDRLILRGGLLRGETIDTVQRFYTDGYFHQHYLPRQLRMDLSPLVVHKITVTHMQKRMIPFIPGYVDERLKQAFGWLLVAEFRKQL